MADEHLIRQLEEISENLWWCWQPDVWQLFRELDRDLWRATSHNPVEFLAEIPDETLLDRARSRALASRIQNAHRRLGEYLDETGPAANPHAGPMHAAPVAYFCAEFCMHESLPIYSGGLGVLAGDHIKTASDLAIPIVGVGLFYHHGYFRQWIDEEGWQQEARGEIDTSVKPIEKVVDPETGEPLEIAVPDGGGGEPIHAHAWRAKVGRNDLYLLDAKISSNSEDQKELSGQLYGGDNRMRIRQELLLGVGGIRLLEELDIQPGVYHLNEGHSAFATFERAARVMENEGVDFWEARRRVARQSVFTTHTPVPAGHDRFDIGLFEEKLGWLREQVGLSHRDFHGLGRVDVDDPDEPFCMTVLALKMSDHRNGVSHIHGRVSRDMWRGIWPGRAESEVPIGHITNGIHVASFLAPEMETLYDRHLESGWRDRMHEPETWEPIGDVSDGEMWETRQIMKSKLLDFIDHRVEVQEAPSGDGEGEVRPGSGFEQDILTVGFARRFARYKRATLILENLEWFKSHINDEERPIQIVYAGKAHPSDDEAKKLIQEIVDLTTDPEFAGRVVFLADYDTHVARHMVQGVDVWLNNPRRPQEACGTSGQKCVFNGVLNCSILDGWWAEAYDGQNGFAIGEGREYANPEAQDAYDAQALYETFDEEVIPLYYQVDEEGIRRQWVDRMKWAMMSANWRFNAGRMLKDYLHEAYRPAAGATSTQMRR
jgi:starch phosphorylase